MTIVVYDSCRYDNCCYDKCSYDKCRGTLNINQMQDLDVLCCLKVMKTIRYTLKRTCHIHTETNPKNKYKDKHKQNTGTNMNRTSK